MKTIHELSELRWIDVLRRLIFTMDEGKSLAFVASCLSYALNHDGNLTPKQEAVCRQILNQVVDQWADGKLHLAEGHPLRDIEPHGHA